MSLAWNCSFPSLLSALVTPKIVTQTWIKGSFYSSPVME